MGVLEQSRMVVRLRFDWPVSSRGAELSEESFVFIILPFTWFWLRNFWNNCVYLTSYQTYTHMIKHSPRVTMSSDGHHAWAELNPSKRVKGVISSLSDQTQLPVTILLSFFLFHTLLLLLFLVCLAIVMALGMWRWGGLSLETSLLW